LSEQILKHVEIQKQIGCVDFINGSLKTGAQERKSSTIKNSYDPEWNEEFVFEVAKDTEERDFLCLTLYDWDRYV
jgi:Ca2+-dependent lipid-binding protein